MALDQGASKSAHQQEQHAIDKRLKDEFFANVKTLLSDDCFKLRKTTSCHELAEIFESIDKDYKAAADLYESTCENMKSGRSCFNLASMRAAGKGTAKNLPLAFQTFAKSCELGSSDGCNNAAMMLQRGVGTEKDLAESEKLFVKACDGLSANGCFNLSVFYLMGGALSKMSKSGSKSEGGLKLSSEPHANYKDMAKALEYSIKACEMDHIHGCINACRMLSVGDGVTQDLKKADFYKKRSEEIQKMNTLTIDWHPNT